MKTSNHIYNILIILSFLIIPSRTMADLLVETFDTTGDTLGTFSLDTLPGDRTTHWFSSSGNGELWLNSWGDPNSIKFNAGVFEVVSFDIRNLHSGHNFSQNIKFYDQNLNVLQTLTLAPIYDNVFHTITVGIDNVSVVQFDHFGSNYAIDNFTYDTGATPVPEPTTMLLFGTGIAGLVGLRRKK